ncbi:PREDICTED: uncharacterized protein C16orf96-like isoform X2 [Branchiostoma belcheri]|uniref:Uncharacterized protein C16orf96-like isoform X2 n=1 Tax=Branchiostoma belcheri TaxID=7741 RepID=A0A6P4ZVK2_BRABE|nr:PREDICTED: uncharacterized protein C16orf96-like isoform X2 [Branchiostoma belcheri]
MPPSTMRLSELVDLSLGTPDMGVVNFNAMHTLFHAIIDHLKITDIETKIGEDIQRERDAQSTMISTRGSGSDVKDGRDGALSRSASSPTEGEYAQRLRQLEDKISSQEIQLNKLNDLPSNTDLLERTRSEGTKPVGEMWQLMQLQRKVEANEAGLTKAMSLIEDLMREVNMLNDNKAKVAKEMKDIKDRLDKMDLTSLSDRISELESYQDKMKKIDELEKQLAELAEQLKKLPTAEEFDAFVTWPVLDEALREERQKYMETKPTDGADESEVLLEQLKSKDPSRPPSAPRPPSSRLSSAKEKYPEALQALKEMATLSFEHEKLSEQVEKLEVTMPTKADKSELEKLLEAALANQKVDVPEDLLEQLAALRDALDMMKNSRDKLDEHSRILDGLINAPPDFLTPPSTPPPTEGEPDAFSLAHTATPVLPPISPTHSANDTPPHRKRPTPPTSPVHRMSDPSRMTPPPSPVRRMSDTSKRPLSPVTSVLPSTGPSKKTSSTGRLMQDLNLQIVGLRAKDAELEKDIKSLKDAVSQRLSFTGVPVQNTSENETIGHSNSSQMGDEHELQSMNQSQTTDTAKTPHDRQSTEVQPQPPSYVEGPTPSKSPMCNTDISNDTKPKNLNENKSKKQPSVITRKERPATKSSTPVKDEKYANKKDEGKENASAEIEKPLPDNQQTNSQKTKAPQVNPAPPMMARHTKLVTPMAPTGWYIPNQKSVKIEDGDMLANLQQKVLQLLADVEQLNGTSSDLVRKSGDLQKSTEALYKVCDKLNDTKADKDYVTMEVDVKADKRALESKVSRQQFDSSFNELNNLIQELLAKLDGQDGQWQDALKNLSDDLDGKLDRLELDPFKEYIQGQLNKLNRKMAKVTEIEQQKELDEAAGFRKQMFRCISCDRPVTMTAGGPVPALPSTNSLPVTATLRPYTTYELEKIRQEQKTPSVGSEDNATRFQKTMAMRKLAKLKRKNIHLYRLVINQGIDQIMAKLMKKRRHRGKDQLLKCQAARLQPLQGPTVGPTLPSLAQPAPQDYDLYFSQPRPCGGSHTMTYPNKRFTKLTAGGQYVVEEQPQVQVFHVKEELDIIGADGHIYKGRVEIDDGRLPTLTQQPKAPVSPGTQRRRGQKPAYSPRSDQRPSPPGRPQSAHATSPRPGSSGQRPHTAGSRSVSRTSQTHVIDESTGEQQHSPPPTRQATPGEGGAGQTEVSATA